MHIRICRIAPFAPQSVLPTYGKQNESLTDDCPQSNAALTITAANSGRLRLSQVLALSFATLVLSVASSSCSGDQLKELAEKAGIKVLADGESSQSAEDQARNSIPLNAMTRQNRQRAQVIINDRSQFRRLPSLQYTID